MTPESLEKLVSWKMPFGKHAGTVLADLPGNYLAWFAREGFPEGELGPVRRGLIEGGLDDLEDFYLADATMERVRKGEEAVLDAADLRKSIAPDLPVAMVREILRARQERLSEQVTEYKFD